MHSKIIRTWDHDRRVACLAQQGVPGLLPLVQQILLLPLQLRQLVRLLVANKRDIHDHHTTHSTKITQVYTKLLQIDINILSSHKLV